MGTLLTGQQGTPALGPDYRVLFIFLYIFFGGNFFFKKNVSLSVSFSLVVHALWVSCGLMYSTNFKDVR
jgi:hypothetical protein